MNLKDKAKLKKFFMTMNIPLKLWLKKVNHQLINMRDEIAENHIKGLLRTLLKLFILDPKNFQRFQKIGNVSHI